MHLDDAFRDREAESGATLLLSDGVVGLLKFLEELLLVRRSDPRSGIRHGDRELSVCRSRFDSDLAAVRELDRVPDQVQQDLRQPATIAVTGGKVRPDVAVRLSDLPVASGSTAVTTVWTTSLSE